MTEQQQWADPKLISLRLPRVLWEKVNQRASSEGLDLEGAIIKILEQSLGRGVPPTAITGFPSREKR